MKRFRIDILDRENRACFHADFLAASDEAAAGLARRLFPDRLIELWEGNRLVGRLDHQPSMLRPARGHYSASRA
jgi:hypothetical protein